MIDEDRSDVPDVVAMTDSWVRELAGSPLVGTRRRLLREVVACSEPLKPMWLELLSDDEDAPVRAAAVEAMLQHVAEADEAAALSRLERQFAEGVVPSGLAWEWEYVISAWLPREGPRARVLFRSQRDDVAVRLMAVTECDELGVKSYPAKGGVFLRSVRLVCEYTRSARSMAEAMRWKREGRPQPPLG